MNSEIPWIKTIATKLGLVFLVLLAISGATAWTNLHFLSRIKGDAAAVNQLGRDRTNATEMLLRVYEAADGSEAQRSSAVTQLKELINLTDNRAQLFIHGDPALGVLPVSDGRVLSELQDRDQAWRAGLRPLLQQLVDAPTVQNARNLLPLVHQQVPKFSKELDDSVSSYQRISEEKVGQFENIQYVFVGILAAVLATLLWRASNLVRRIRALIFVAQKISHNDFSKDAPIEGSDEIAIFGKAFNTMTAHLQENAETERQARARIEQLLSTIGETANNLASASAELLAGTTQQSASAQEQAAAVAQTVATVDEVKQTSEQAAQRAKTVAESAQRAAEISKVGRQAVDQSVEAMASVKEQTEAIAVNILALAEKAQAIGEIIASVNDVAEQTNLLALNAGIEASRAGEHGAGFTVVAREIKDLAEQAKKATAQVRQILGEIQKATNSAVMVTEEGSKSVNTTIKAVNKAGETIRTLTTTIDDAAIAANQITASSAQQTTGMAQVQQAMRDINEATTQSLASTKQAEKAAEDLNALGVRLKELLAG